MINNADIEFPEVSLEDGTKAPLSHGRYGLLMESKNRAVRKDAFTKMHETYAKLNNTLASTLSGQVKTIT